MLEVIAEAWRRAGDCRSLARSYPAELHRWLVLILPPRAAVGLHPARRADAEGMALDASSGTIRLQRLALRPHPLCYSHCNLLRPIRVKARVSTPTRVCSRDFVPMRGVEAALSFFLFLILVHFSLYFHQFIHPSIHLFVHPERPGLPDSADQSYCIPRSTRTFTAGAEQSRTEQNTFIPPFINSCTHAYYCCYPFSSCSSSSARTVRTRAVGALPCRDSRGHLERRRAQHDQVGAEGGRRGAM